MRDFEGVVGHSGTMFLSLRSGLGLVAALATSLALGGCGGIEFKGKLFDYAGLSGDGTQKDVKMAARAPLVLPPNTNVLPPPGEPAYTARQDWPTNPEVQQKQAVAAKQAEDLKEKAAADPNDPWAGKPRLLDIIYNKYKKKDVDPDALVDVPEPDPADKTPEDKARDQRAVAANGGAKPLPPQVIEPQPPAEEDPFHPATPDSYRQIQSGQTGE